MVRLGAVIVCTAFAIALSACAPRYDTATDAAGPAQGRLDRIASRVMRAAGEFCESGPRTAGTPATTASAHGAGLNEPAPSGLRAGGSPDRGRPLAAKPRAPVQPSERGIMPDPGTSSAEEALGAAGPQCRYPIEVSGRGVVYASTNGQRIRITEGMLAFASNDSELAFVLSHELAHDLLGHPGAFHGGGRQRMELEADYVGIYVTARAGYDVEVAAHFILRLASAFPSIREDSSYPAPAARYASLQLALKEIALKKSASAPLVPDFTTRLPRPL